MTEYECPAWIATLGELAKRRKNDRSFEKNNHRLQRTHLQL
jgi:hypothetical protein